MRVTKTLARRANESGVASGEEGELTVSVCPLGSRATNGEGGKLGSGLGSRAKVKLCSGRPRVKCGGRPDPWPDRMPGGAGELQVTVAQKANQTHVCTVVK